ncbi:Uncharacterised protein [Klebsiella quasipneumoniae]|nr:Uncharacterised protein [Klebsiella quasipneumoniae]
MAEDRPLARCWPVLELLLLQSVCNGFAPGKRLFCVIYLKAQGAKTATGQFLLPPVEG